jgi:uncharacterized repeat protein (TIGR03837 family)
MRSRSTWDVFCHVVDNLGDIGVCWRVAADLAARGVEVRLWVDDASALAWMAPQGAPGVEVVAWAEPLPQREPGDVVVEAFGCRLPDDFVARMAARAVAPVWIDLEHLSAEAYVERSHGLPSPQLAGPGRGLTKWFYFPGFTPRTGALPREPGLLQARAAFDRHAWLAARAWLPRPGERVVVLFCYPNAALPALLAALDAQPTLLLLTPGPAQQQVHALPLPTRVRTIDLPWLPHPEFDRLLWSADLNFVRGEDSIVRALWAANPFAWQLYPQHDGAHGPKLEAFADLFTAGAAAPFGDAWRTLMRGWNGIGAPAIGQALALPQAGAWRAAAQAFRARLAAHEDLVTALLRFAADKGAAPRAWRGDATPGG